MNKSASGPVRIGLIDFEPLRVAGLMEILGTRADFCAMPLGLAEALRRTPCQAALYAIRPGRLALDLVARVRVRNPEMKLLLMGPSVTDETISAALVTGAKGWLEERASPEQIIQAVDVVLAGSAWAPHRVLAQLVERAYGSGGAASAMRPGRETPQCTGRETEVLRHLVLARSNREIAAALSIREQTVKSYVTRLMRKFGVRNRIALSVEAAERDLPETEQA